MHELPLVIFTILSQMVIGGFITLWWMDRKPNAVSPKNGLLITVILIGLGGVASLLSMFHLGQPLHAYRAILNIGVSWLSREIAFFMIFLGLSLLYAWFWFKNDPNRRNLIGGIASFFGVITIFSSAMIYVLPAIPAWNGMTTIFMFYLTSILLGPLFVFVLLAFKGELSVNVCKLTIPSLILAVIVMVGYFSSLLGGLPEAVETAKLTMNSILFWIRTILLLGALILLSFAYKNKKMQRTSLYTLALTILFISEFLGRFQFYETAIHL